MRNATLCFLVRGDPPVEILLGFKKVGFGAGKYNGFGGKVETGETIEEAAVREVEEEIGVSVIQENLRRVGELGFRFPAQPEWDQIVHVFMTHEWRGIPAESEEMRPQWVAVEAVPYQEMWADDVYWLPRVLEGGRIRGWFVFGEDGETLEAWEVEEWT